MMGNFDRCFAAVIGLEGGYVNDPKDPGGETKYGISKRAHPAEDIKNLTLERAKEIYRRGYWEPIRGDLIPAPLDAYMFDAAVNQGTDAAIRMLQKVIGVAQDGVFGLDTQKRVQTASKEQAALFMAERALRYYGTRNFDLYGRGWLKRLFIIARES